MTVKEIAFFVDKNKSTVGRWVAKCNSRGIVEKLRKATRDNPADFNIDELEEILNASSLSRDAVMILMANARESNQIVPVISNTHAQVDYEIIGRMIGMAVTAAMKPIIDQMQSFTDSPVARIAHEPEMDVRSMINRTVNNHVRRTGTDHKTAYNELYREFNYYHRMNVGLAARNRDVKVIDYIESIDMLPELLAVAKKIFAPGQLI